MSKLKNVTKKRLLLILAICIGLAAIGAKAHLVFSAGAEKVAPEFSLSNTDGDESVSLTSLNNRPALLLIANESKSSQE